MLSKVQEKLLHSETELLEEFLSDALAYSCDQAQDVRKAIVGFIEEIWYGFETSLILNLMAN